MVQKLEMRAFFNNLAFVQNDDSVHMLDGGKPVGDDDGTAILDEFRQGILNQEFRFCVDV